VEKEWRSSKYSVNSECIYKNNEERNIKDVKIKQLATRKTRKQDDDKKISKLQHERQPPQLTANKTDNNNLKEASKLSAIQGKSIIPARRWLLSKSFYGSLNKKDSNKELGPLDNTYKNTSTRTRTYKNLINTNIYTKNPTHQKYPTNMSNSHYIPNFRTDHKLTLIENKGHRKGHCITLHTKIMAPKTIWIHNLDTSAEPKLKMAPKQNFMLAGSSVEQNLKLAPKNHEITTTAGSALASAKSKQAPKGIQTYFTTKPKIAPSKSRIQKLTFIKKICAKNILDPLLCFENH